MSLGAFAKSVRKPVGLDKTAPLTENCRRAVEMVAGTGKEVTLSSDLISDCGMDSLDIVEVTFLIDEFYKLDAAHWEDLWVVIVPHWAIGQLGVLTPAVIAAHVGRLIEE